MKDSELSSELFSYTSALAYFVRSELRFFSGIVTLMQVEIVHVQAQSAGSCCTTASVIPSGQEVRLDLLLVLINTEIVGNLLGFSWYTLAWMVL